MVAGGKNSGARSSVEACGFRGFCPGTGAIQFIQRTVALGAIVLCWPEVSSGDWEGRGAGLQVHVRALSWILAMRRRAFDDLDLKLYRKFLGGIAGCLVAGLILQLAANHIARRNHAG